MREKLLNESTSVEAESSAAEIARELVGAGAIQITTQYRNGRVHGLAWTMMMRGQQAFFAMPARSEAVYAILEKREKRPFTLQRKQLLIDKAQRVAWRHLYRWVQAQVAMIRTGMMEPAEPFCPFMTIPGHDQTLFQAVAATGLLPAPEVKQ